MSKRDWHLYIEDILDCIKKIEEYIGQMDCKDLKGDSKTADAIIRNLEIIGEASKNIPDPIKGQYSDVPWLDMADLRNRVAHGYFEINLEVVWNIIKGEIPKLKEQMKYILERV